MCCLLDCVWGRHNIGFVAVKHFMDTYASQVTVRAALLCPKSGYYPLFALIKAVALTWGTVACIDCSVVCLVQESSSSWNMKRATTVMWRGSVWRSSRMWQIRATSTQWTTW